MKTWPAQGRRALCCITIVLLLGVVPPRSVGGDDRTFLTTLMADTWRCLEAMIEPSTGLPRDTQRPGGKTNTTNIGLYLASLCAARQAGLVEDAHALKRAERILASLDTFRRVHGFMPNFIDVDLADRDAHGVMAVSDFNKLVVGLIMVRRSWPQLTGRVDRFLDAIQWSRLYDRETGLLLWGYDLDKRTGVGETRLWLSADTRSAAFMMVATEAAPPEIWARMERHPKETSVGRILRGYGMGGLFLHAMDGIFLPELDTEVGESVGNLAWQQVQFARRHGYPLWGWSNCYIPGGGYTQGGFLPERVVTPHAAALVIEYYPRHVTAALREMEQRGGRVPPAGYEGKRWGLRDSYDMKAERWDDRYLSLDQGMLFLSLANYLHDGVVRRIYTADPLVQRGLELLKPHIRHDPSLVTRWAKRDATHTAKPPVGRESAPASPRTHVVPLDNFHSSHKTALSLTGTNQVPVLHYRAQAENVLGTFRFPEVDLSALVRLELDVDVPRPAKESPGDIRILVEDRFGQQRYAPIRLEPGRKVYTIPADELYGMYLDETAVGTLHIRFWRSPWFYTERRMRAEACELKIRAIRFVTDSPRSAAGAIRSTSGRRTNIVLILADDLGYADVGYHGCVDVPTPHIDSIAREGVRFTEGYSNGAVCAPTRAALMTGRYQGRFGSQTNPGPYRRSPTVKIGVTPKQPLLSQRLKALGYVTGCFGKWHLGGEILGDPALMPLNRGFDEFFGFLEGAASYVDHDNREEKYWRNDKLVRTEKEYYTDALGREAVTFIKRHRDKPFFLYLPFSAVHAPMQAPPGYVTKCSHIEEPMRRKLAAMLSAMDDNIGRVLRALHETGLDQRTFVIFMSDNGGKPDNNGSLNIPLRGEKGQYYEGGIHVPFCMKWPGQIEPGQVYREPVIGMDLFPTVVAAAGGKVRAEWKLDGVDLLPFVKGAARGCPHDVLHWGDARRFAIREGEWKLVCERGKPCLFNLEKDPSETEDVLAEHPAVHRRLQRKHRQWVSELMPPQYGWDQSLGKRIEGAWKWKRPREGP